MSNVPWCAYLSLLSLSGVLCFKVVTPRAPAKAARAFGAASLPTNFTQVRTFLRPAPPAFLNQLPTTDNRHNTKGMVSMANSGANTNKSQFFLTFDKQPHLNNVYTGAVLS